MGKAKEVKPEDKTVEPTLYERIAKVCHQANKAYCESIGDTSQVNWDEAPDWQKESAIAGVQAIDENPDSQPSDSHAGWMQHKTEDGWRYGEVKDADAKTHPSMLPWHALTDQDRAKDCIFHSIVIALLDY